MKACYPPIIIRVENHLVYYNGIDKANASEDFGYFIKLVSGEVEVSLDLYLNAI